MLYFGKDIKINTEKYGDIKVTLDSRNKFGNCYYVLSKKKKLFSKETEISGIIDSSCNEIVPFDESILVETIISKDLKNYCFGFKYPDSEILEYYHIRCVDNYCTLVKKTNRTAELPLKVRMIKDNDDYWLFETVSNCPQYAIYDYKNARMATNFFNRLEFLDYDSPYHMAYFEVDIFSNIERDEDEIETVNHTTLCGFLDDQCNLSSELLDTERRVVYNSYMYGPTTLDRRFLELIDALKTKYLDDYFKNENEVNTILNTMYNCYNTSDRIELNGKAKILEFKPRKNVDYEKK